MSTRSSSRIRSGRTSSHSKSAAKDEETKEKTARQVCSEPAQHCDKEDREASEGDIDQSSNGEDQKDAPVPAAEEEKACSNEDNAETKMEDNVETRPDSIKTGMESSFQANNPVGKCLDVIHSLTALMVAWSQIWYLFL
jgi:hypothetical protein